MQLAKIVFCLHLEFNQIFFLHMNKSRFCKVIKLETMALEGDKIILKIGGYFLGFFNFFITFPRQRPFKKNFGPHDAVVLLKPFVIGYANLYQRVNNYFKQIRSSIIK